MMIVCPNCATSYQVEPSSLGAGGRSVRCARCKLTWFAARPAARSQPAETPLAEPWRDPAPVDATEPAASVPLAPAAAPTAPPEPPTAVPEGVRFDDPGPPPLTHDPQPVGATSATVEDVHLPEPQAGTDLPPVSVPEDIETAAARRIRRGAHRRRTQWLDSRWTTALLALFAINAGLIGWRADVVRFLPQSASLYAAIGLPVNLRGLVFADIVTRKEMQDGVQMLVVEGIIQSTSRRVADVPRLRFAVRNAGGQEIYSWTALPTRNLLPPGATLPFRSRLASPPPEAHAVMVRFFNRRDLVAGVH